MKNTSHIRISFNLIVFIALSIIFVMGVLNYFKLLEASATINSSNKILFIGFNKDNISNITDQSISSTNETLNILPNITQQLMQSPFPLFIESNASKNYNISSEPLPPLLQQYLQLLWPQQQQQTFQNIENMRQNFYNMTSIFSESSPISQILLEHFQLMLKDQMQTFENNPLGQQILVDTWRYMLPSEIEDKVISVITSRQNLQQSFGILLQNSTN